MRNATHLHPLGIHDASLQQSESEYRQNECFGHSWPLLVTDKCMEATALNETRIAEASGPQQIQA